MADGPNELTVEKLVALADQFKPYPRMPRWKDLTWAQRNEVEREIWSTTDPLVRGAMQADYYRDED